MHRLKIRSSDGRDMLLKVVKNPISRHIPAGARCFGMTSIRILLLLSFQIDFSLCLAGFSQQGTLYSPTALATSIPDDVPVVFVFGAFAIGMIQAADHPYVRYSYFPFLMLLIVFLNFSVVMCIISRCKR